MTIETATAEAKQEPSQMDESKTIQARFEKFHRKNPHVFYLYKKFALELRATGRAKCGISLITERIRWEVFTTTEGEEFKICNDFRSRYARKLMREVPELSGFFSVKQLRTE